MITTIEKPRISPVQFVEADPSFDARYNMRHMLATWYGLSFREMEEHTRYFQKWQFNQRVEVQFHTLALTASPTVDLLDKDLNVVHTWNAPQQVTLTGNIDPYTGGQLITWHFRMPLNTLSIAEGVYFFRFNASFTTGGTPIVRQEISEPQLLRHVHPGTILLEYSNDTNNYNAVFEQTAAQFSVCLEGDIQNYLPQSVFTTFTDQNQVISKIYGQPARQWSLNVGANARRPGRGIPDWLWDKVDAITLLDHWRADGKEFIRDGSKWEPTQFDAYPLKAANLAVQPANPDEDTFSVQAGPITLFTTPAYPFALGSIAIGLNSPYIQLLSAPRLLNASGDLATLITDTNTYISGTLGLAGTVSDTGTEVIYTPADGEFFQTASSDLYPYYTQYTLAANASPFTTNIGIKGARVIVDWGITSGFVPVITAGFAPPTIITTLSHTYPAGGGRTIRIFHNNVLFGLFISDTNRRTFTGTLPTTLNTISLNLGSFTSDTLDWSIFAPCQAALQSLTVTNAALVTMPSANTYYFPQLRTINCSGNAFDQAHVGFFMYDVYYNSSNHATGFPITSGGTFSVNNQSPPVTSLDFNGTFYKGILKASPFFWAVNT